MFDSISHYLQPAVEHCNASLSLTPPSEGQWLNITKHIYSSAVLPIYFYSTTVQQDKILYTPLHLFDIFSY